jgi:uncharacterized protein YraI
MMAILKLIWFQLEGIMKSKTILFGMLAVWLIILSCNLPFGKVTPTPTVTGTTVGQTATPPTPDVLLTITLTKTSLPTETVPVPPTACIPNVTSTTPVNIRSGPSTVFPTVGALTPGTTAQVAGKNTDGTWWYINYSGGNGWVSSSVVTAACVPASITIVASPPTPLPPSGTCKDGFEYRLIKSSDKVCVSTASKNQADADNAAADSRKLVNVYGADACKVGFVWREAFSGDKVCVTSAVRSQVIADNAAAASRWEVGPYGPHTCISGFVWREAQSGDDVCVTSDVRTQAATDNAAASSRIAGANDCISGYVWREAFSGDKVCVTTAVKSQVAADNAAAPGHTW